MRRPRLLVWTLAGLTAAVAFGCASDAAEENAPGAGAGGELSGAGSAGSGGSAAGSGAAASGGEENQAAGGSDDLPYANVTAVSASGADEDYDFSVSVESADIDCTQFADFWEVLSEDGALLYRRVLEHSHTDENGTSDEDAPGNTFTRSGGPVAVSAETVVIVRAHMSNVDGYNGRVQRGSVAEGFADAPDIGSDFAAGVEDDEPQPTGCSF